MKKNNSINIILLVCIALSISFIGRSHTLQPIDGAGRRLFRSLLKPVVSDNQDTLYEGYYAVYENREKKGRKINLHILVLPALNKKDIHSPVFYFQGGPGDAATAMQMFYQKHPIYRQERDIVLIDFRGTGLSNPLHCDGTQKRSTAQQSMNEMFPIDSVSKCYAELSKIADLSQYSTEFAINDIEEIRQWLGYDKINILGQSYGTRACQYYMRQFPQSVRSSVMIGPLPNNLKMPLHHAEDGQRVWDLIVEECKNDPSARQKYPGISNEFQAIINHLSNNKFTYYYYDSAMKKGEVLRIKVGPFCDLLRSIMYTVNGQRKVPFLIHEAFKGNFAPLIQIAIARNSDPYSLADGFYLCTTCSEDVPFIRNTDVKDATAGTYMGKYRIDQQMAACRIWQMKPVALKFTEPVQSTIPALVISGNHDPITPPKWGDTVIQKMKNAQHLKIPQMGHGISGLSNEACYHKLVADFINSPSVKINPECISTMEMPAFK